MSPTRADPDQAGSLHHVELGVRDVERAEPFWDWLLTELGYEPKDDWDGGRSWILGPTYVVLKAVDGEVPHERHNPGLDHLAFHAGSREQVDRITERVRESDSPTLLYPDEHPYAGGYYAAYVEGPTGITIEVVAPE
jgi:catechol 2,3-dioxygenase-like lactoylglutathione lyase family enzyme